MINIKDNPLKEYENQINSLDKLQKHSKSIKKLTDLEKINLELRELVSKLKKKSS